MSAPATPATGATPFGNWRSTRGRIAVLARDNPGADLAALRTRMRAEKALETIAHIVKDDELDAMTPEQRQAFAEMLGTYTDQIRQGNDAEARLTGGEA